MKQFKTYLRVGYVVIILGMVLAIVYYLNETAKYEELYNKELTNVKAYQSENNDLKNQSIAHIMTFNDSRLV
jgi:hypothetical protein